MTKVFVATSFSDKVDVAGAVVPEYRHFIEGLLQKLRADKGLEVFCAIEDEGWVLKNGLAQDGVGKDLQELANSDVLLALVNGKPSAGVQFEIGYAVAKGKRVIIAADNHTKLSYYNQGIVDLRLTEFTHFENTDEIVTAVHHLA